MKIHFLSDVHNERSPYEPPPTDADLVILAGDIHEGTQGMAWAEEHYFCPVLYLAGNHEYFRGHLEHTQTQLRARSNDRIHYLDQDSIVIDGIRFLGVTAWTDFTSTGNPAKAKWDMRIRFRDFDRIRSVNGRFSEPADYITLNHAAYAWLKQGLSRPFDGHTVVITHHAPLMRSLESQPHPHSDLDAAFANQWEDLMGSATLWIHGHTHVVVDYAHSGTRIVSNPRGVPGEQTGFRPDWAITL